MLKKILVIIIFLSSSLFSMEQIANKEKTRELLANATDVRSLRSATVNYAKEKPIMLKVGQTAKISLKSNPTTGYSWQINPPLSQQAIIYLQSKGFKSPKNPRIGQGGDQYWVFKGKKPGQTTLTFEYKRPWETNTPPATIKTFTFKVK